MTEKAKTIMLDGGYTCVAVFVDKVYTSTLRGVKPLIAWYESGALPRDFCAADKAIGKGAAFLYVLLGAKALYTPLISTAALQVLTDAGIAVSYDQIVPMIKNRSMTGFCPMELCTRDINDPAEALSAMKKKLAELSRS